MIERFKELTRSSTKLDDFEVLFAEPEFPQTVRHMLEVGNQSGKMETMTKLIADLYATQLESTLGIAVSLLEPLVMLLMGIIAGVVVMAVMVPLLQQMANLA